jgi:hypothetical protein
MLPILAGVLLPVSQSWAANVREAPLSLPIQIVESNAITEITVGTRKVKVGVDTGGGGIELDADVIRDAGGVPLNRKQQGNDAYGRESSVPLFRVPQMTIGGKTFRNVVVAQAEPNEDGPAVPGSIGRHFLYQYLVVIDYPGSAIKLWPRDSEAGRATCGNTRMPMERTKESHLVISTFSTPAGSFRLVWDTGATYSALQDVFAADRKLALTDMQGTSFHIASSFKGGGQDFGALEFVVLPVQPPDRTHGFLGANFFSNHVVCLDYGKREVRIR